MKSADAARRKGAASERGLAMRHLLTACGVAVLVVAGARGGEPPAREALLKQAARCRQILKTSLVDFYLPAAVG